MVSRINFFFIRRRRSGLVLSLIVVFLIAVAKLYNVGVTYDQTKRVLDKEDIPKMPLYAVKQTKPDNLGIIVLSRRDAFDNRESIRNTWSSNHTNVYFMVGEQVCPYPHDACVPGTCQLSNKPVSQSRLEQFQLEEEMKTRSIRNEAQVIMLPVVDATKCLSVKVIEAYKWALINLDYKWILNVFDDSYVRIDLLEEYLLNVQSGVAIIGPEALKWNEFPEGLEENNNIKTLPLVSTPFIISRTIAIYSFGNEDIKHKTLDKSFGETLDKLLHTKHMQDLEQSFKLTESGDCLNKSILVFGHGVLQRTMALCHKKDVAKKDPDSTNQEIKVPVKSFVFQPPTNFLIASRFDIIVKIIYAYFYLKNDKIVPQIFQDAYTEHLLVWNHFQEDKKNSQTDFIYAFHRVIESIKANGFVSEYGRIPVYANGFPVNGAHRIAAAVALSENVTFEQSQKQPNQWDYSYFLSLGFKLELADAVMMQWMALQRTLSISNKMVFILSVFSTKAELTDKMYQIVKNKCSLDNDILYERTINLNRLGIEQLIRHLYGNQNWIETKIKQMVSKVTSTTLKIRFIFFFGKPLADLNDCKLQIRHLYNENDFKSAAHITDSAKESLILAEMILNPNSVEFLNYGKNGRDCQVIAKELASRLGISQVSTMPGIYIGREDFMVDSGSVLNLFDLRKRTDVDILFLNEIDKSILGRSKTMNIEAHAFKENAISSGRAWGEDHFSQLVKTKWDLFYDPRNYGFCYGIKFVSLKQLIDYKKKRAEVKDKKDISLMEGLIRQIDSRGVAAAEINVIAKTIIFTQLLYFNFIYCTWSQTFF